MAESTKVLAQWDKGRDRVVVSLREYNGRRGLDVREQYEKDGEWLPTKKGMWMDAQQAELLGEALEKHKDEIVAFLNAAQTEGK